jgi:hypothetical protein
MEDVDLPKQRVSAAKVVGALLACAVSALCAYFAQPRYHENSDAVLIIATAFTILAGFLVSVIAMTADERSLRGRNWRQDVGYFELIRGDINRHKNLFYLYLVVVSLAFIASLGRESCGPVQIWWERAVLFSACLGMIFSFRLPGYITRRQISVLDGIIENRMKLETIPRPFSQKPDDGKTPNVTDASNGDQR